MPTELTIRPATTDDYASIDRLLEELDDYHVRILPDVFQPVGDSTRPRDRIARFVDRDDAEMFLAQCGAEIVGLASVRIYDSPAAPMFRPDPRACIDDLVVQPEHRSHGVARRLLDEAARWTRSRRLSRLDINVWNENKLGMSFFQAVGFQPRCQRMELRVDEAT